MKKRVYSQKVASGKENKVEDNKVFAVDNAKSAKVSRKIMKPRVSASKNAQTPQEKQTPKLKLNDVIDFYQKVVVVFQCKEHKIIARDQEKKEIEEFLLANIQNKQSGFLYLCGHPGTGKTSLLVQILKDLTFKNLELDYLILNAMSFTDLDCLIEEIRSRYASQLKTHQSFNEVIHTFEGLSKPKVKDSIEDNIVILSNLIQKFSQICKIKHIILVIDEIDAFSKVAQTQVHFNNLLKLLIHKDRMNISIVGIANSVEMFKGELTMTSQFQNSQMICKNEKKLIFPPYDKAKIITILSQLYSNYINEQYSPQSKRDQLKSLIDARSFDIAASKVDKLSGDLRQAFAIIHRCIFDKLQILKKQSDDQTLNLEISYDDVNTTIIQIYQSKTANILKQVPRSHIMLLNIIYDLFNQQNLAQVDEEKLLSEYNRNSQSFMIERIRMSELLDMIETLSNFSIISRVDKKSGQGSKKIKLVRLIVSMEELQQALEYSQSKL
ncbi:cell division control protein 6 homolog [Stylonychia lemnae]|uniref:Cell division control protein 6 homolog n=1 Tax=Stylonychia lemnae TaxID=5949 RepID=A0A078AL11_STYLE|nr:cell division control protein 6 homolog [Stylonychia lemnae]|eukprot:CDW83055.1 cell division control protein 6 homolog [Stylonychia lemnae]